MLLQSQKNKVKVFLILSLLLLTSTPASEAKLQTEEEKTIQIFEDVSPSVAFIKNASLQWDWFSSDVYEVPRGAGSGFVWDEDGHIITNFHVIYRADKIEVILNNQEPYYARIVGLSPDHDLAVLKIDAPKEILKPIALGRSHDLKVGQRTLSIGNPFGLDYSLTTGVVSALGRSMRSATGRKIYDVIQTDAAVNPGSSGGPLLNSEGKAIAVTSAIYSPSGAYAGVGFAIPIDVVKRIVPDLIKYGKVKRAGLGIKVAPENIRKGLGIKGVLILETQMGSSAQKAGLRPTKRNYRGRIIYGDVITAINDTPITNNEDLMEFFYKDVKVGDKVDIQFMRGKKEFGTTAILQEIK